MKKMSLILVFMMVILVFTSCNTEDPELDQANETIKELKETIESDKDVIEDLNKESELLLEEIKDKELIIKENSIQLEEFESNNIILEEKLTDLEEANDELMLTGPTSGASLLTEAVNVIHLMSINDYANLSLYVDPSDGLRLSPYQYVDVGTDIVLTTADVAAIASYPMTNWGTFDGTGDPIDLTGIDYYNQFIYSNDFVNAPFIGQNMVLSSGNMINNIATVYPGASFVEFYYDGFDPIYDGLDWRSLTVVMKNVGGQWYLIGLVHGQWTI